MTKDRIAINPYPGPLGVFEGSVKFIPSKIASSNEITFTFVCEDSMPLDLHEITDAVIIQTGQEDQRIDEFVTSVIGSYEKGKVFYELTKPEIIQPHKQIVLQQLNTGRVLGGESIRGMLGVRQNGNEKYDPRWRVWNHTYRAFVQSTSVNRKLKARTWVLIRTS